MPEQWLYRAVLIIVPRQWGRNRLLSLDIGEGFSKGNTKGIDLFKSGPITEGLRVWMGLHSTALPGYSSQESKHN